MQIAAAVPTDWQSIRSDSNLPQSTIFEMENWKICQSYCHFQSSEKKATKKHVVEWAFCADEPAWDAVGAKPNSSSSYLVNILVFVETERVSENHVSAKATPWKEDFSNVPNAGEIVLWQSTKEERTVLDQSLHDHPLDCPSVEIYRNHYSTVPPAVVFPPE